MAVEASVNQLLNEINELIKVTSFGSNFVFPPPFSVFAFSSFTLSLIKHIHLTRKERTEKVLQLRRRPQHGKSPRCFGPLHRAGRGDFSDNCCPI
jgi:hypothetical protein